MKHLHNLKQLSDTDLKEILDKGLEIKANPQQFYDLLKHQTLGHDFSEDLDPYPGFL